MKTFRVVVEQEIFVTLDEATFTDQFMADFRASFFDFQALDEHAEHLGRLAALGIIDDAPETFVEGYGPLSSMGIGFREGSLDVETNEVREDAA